MQVTAGVAEIPSPQTVVRGWFCILYRWLLEVFGLMECYILSIYRKVIRQRPKRKYCFAFVLFLAALLILQNQRRTFKTLTS